jgi:Tol biopolymer transport system component/tRNA A-37 threonylcarbamoyl transferase component Bud32
LTELNPRLSGALSDRYRIDRELGQGGMATVYLAQDLKHDRKVALKVLKPELAAVLGADRFVVEIKTTASLQHPHILPLFDSGTADGFLYYVMPFIQGETLRDRLNRETQLGVDEAVKIAIDVADALHYAHSQGVIHRDIKPENILIQNGRPMVADFGIALAVSAAAGGRMTETGLSLGTPHYMSPEQATADKEITGRSDVYSLASVLYEMLAGQPPHLGGSAQQIIMKIIAEPVETVTRYRKSVPPNVAAALDRALEKLPADRFDSAKAFSDALGNPSFASAVAARDTGGAALPRWQRRAIVPLAAIAVLAVIAAVHGWTRPAPPRPVARYHLGLPDSAPLSGAIARIAAPGDGSWLVYRSGGLQESTNGLWIRRRDNLTSTKLAGTQGAQSPFVSPNGEAIGYFANNSLWTVPLTGGSPVKIAEGTFAENGGSWGPQDVLYVDGPGPSPLQKVRATPGSVAEPFTQLDTSANETDHVSPEVLPSGKGVIFVTRIGGYETWEVAVADIKTGEHRRLTRGVYARYAKSGHLLIVTASGILTAARFDERAMQVLGTPVSLGDKVGLRGFFRTADLLITGDGTLVYAPDDSWPGGNSGELMWVARDGRAVPVAPGWTTAALFPALSPDNHQVALSIRDESGNLQLWVRDLQRGTAKKLTHRFAINWRPSWQADSRSLMYLSTRTKAGEVLLRRLDGTDDDSLVLTRQSEISEAMTTVDGQWIVYRQGANAVSDLYARRLTGDTTPVALATSEFLERNPEVSPNGQYLSYTSNETGPSEVYLRPFPRASENKWLVSTTGGMNPVWSRDGKELFYRNGSGDLVAVEVTAGTPPIGRQRVLFSALPYIFPPTHRSYDVASDGRFLMVRLVNNADVVSAPLVVVENFFEELRRKVPE